MACDVRYVDKNYWLMFREVWTVQAPSLTIYIDRETQYLVKLVCRHIDVLTSMPLTHKQLGREYTSKKNATESRVAPDWFQYYPLIQA